MRFHPAGNARRDYDSHLALHSNASGPGSEGQKPGDHRLLLSRQRQRAAGAEMFASALQEIYPLPDQVTTRSTTTLAEVKRTKAPAVLLEIGYHDNVADAQWIERAHRRSSPRPWYRL